MLYDIAMGNTYTNIYYVMYTLNKAVHKYWLYKSPMLVLSNKHANITQIILTYTST